MVSFQSQLKLSIGRAESEKREHPCAGNALTYRNYAVVIYFFATATNENSTMLIALSSAFLPF